MISQSLQWAITKIMEIAKAGFYGSITLKFENGKLVHMDRNESYKPPTDERGIDVGK